MGISFDCLEVAEDAIDPAVVADAVDTFARKERRGGVRGIARYIEDKIADGLLEAKSSGATHVRIEAEGDDLRVMPIAPNKTGR